MLSEQNKEVCKALTDKNSEIKSKQDMLEQFLKGLEVFLILNSSLLKRKHDNPSPDDKTGEISQRSNKRNKQRHIIIRGKQRKS